MFVVSMSLSLHGDHPLAPPTSTVPELLWVPGSLSHPARCDLPYIVLGWNGIMHCSQSMRHRLALENVVGFDLQRVWESRVRYEAVKRRFQVTTGLGWGCGGGWPQGLHSCGQCNQLSDSSVGTYMNLANSHIWDFKKSWWSFRAVVLQV